MEHKIKPRSIDSLVLRESKSYDNNFDMLILADNKSESWSFAQSVVNKIKEKYDKELTLSPIENRRFADSEAYLYIPVNIRKKDVFFIHDSSKNPQEWFVELLLVNDALRRASASSITDVLPYLKYSRQDRKDNPHVPISAKALADAISLSADRVITADLHASQIQGFYNIPLDNLYSFSYATRYLKEEYPELLNNVIVVAPDAGSVDRARSFARRLNCEIAIIDKRREEANKVAEMRIIGDVANKNVLIVDDLIDTGNTLVEASKILKEKNVNKIFTYATNAVFSDNAEEKVLKAFDKVIVSNTIPKKLNKEIEIVDLSGLFGEAIYRAQNGLSISELFYD